MLSDIAANAIVWPTLVVLLLFGCTIAYWKSDAKTFISANGTQKGIPLALNLIATGVGCGVLSSYPEMANMAGLHGHLVYVLTSSLPMLVFAYFGPLIKKTCPDGFLLTEWVYRRYGSVAGYYITLCTILTLFLFLASEVYSVRASIETLTGLNSTAIVVVQCVITTVYTSIGGFHVSFITDTIQTMIVFVLLLACTIGIAKNLRIDTSLIGPSKLLQPNRLGWKLVYILTIAIFTNDFFMSGFWLRAFAARSDRDLMVGCGLATAILIVFLGLIGSTGMLSVWAGYNEVAEVGASPFYDILKHMPLGIQGLVLLFTLILSTCTFDTLQSALVSTISNSIFKNKLPLLYSRVVVGLVMIPAIIVGMVAQDILRIYLIVDLLSSAVIPILMLGLYSKMDFLTVWEIVGGGLGGLFCVFLFGTGYYHSAKDGARLLIIDQGLYADDWGVFGAMVVAPLGSISLAAIIFAVRRSLAYIQCRRQNRPFELFEKDPQILVEVHSEETELKPKTSASSSDVTYAAVTSPHQNVSSTNQV